MSYSDAIPSADIATTDGNWLSVNPLQQKWDAALTQAQMDKANVPGVKVAAVGDVYGVTPAKGCGVVDGTTTGINVGGQRAFGAWSGEAYSHVMIEIPSKDGKRQVYESNPGTGPKIRDFEEATYDHGKHCQAVHRYAPNVPLTDQQKADLKTNAEIKVNKDMGYNYRIPINRSHGGPEQCAQAVQNLQKASKIPTFVNERFGVWAPFPSELSVSPNYRRVPSDATYRGVTTDIRPKADPSSFMLNMQHDLRNYFHIPGL